MPLIRNLANALSHEARTLRGVVYKRLAGRGGVNPDVAAEFHRMYFDARDFNLTWRNTFYLGHPILKCPLDLWLYQEIIHRIRPGLIVETGTAFGGSALYLANLCDTIGHGRVMTVDLNPKPDLPAHPRLEYVVGSSTAPEIFARVKAAAAQAGPVIVFLDSDHAMGHVEREMELYHALVTPGSYLVVEDTNLNGHPVMPNHGPGPWEAVERFTQRHQEFAHDTAMDKFLLSFNPRGYLKRLH